MLIIVLFIFQSQFLDNHSFYILQSRSNSCHLDCIVKYHSIQLFSFLQLHVVVAGFHITTFAFPKLITWLDISQHGVHLHLNILHKLYRHYYGVYRFLETSGKEGTHKRIAAELK